LSQVAAVSSFLLYYQHNFREDLKRHNADFPLTKEARIGRVRSKRLFGALTYLYFAKDALPRIINAMARTMSPTPKIIVNSENGWLNIPQDAKSNPMTTRISGSIEPATPARS